MCTKLIISKSGIHKRRPTVVVGLAFKAGRGDVEQFLSADAQRNRWRACDYVSTSSEQESMQQPLLVKFLFLVQHFGTKLNSG